jgi:integrase
MAPDRGTTSDVRIWSISTYRGARRTTYTVRWRTSHTRHQTTFATRKLAESFHARLTRSAREGEDFRTADGLPSSTTAATAPLTWYEFAAGFIDMKWEHASPRHRKSLAEGLVTVTSTLTTPSTDAPDAEQLRRMLLNWSFNTAARKGKAIAASEPPPEFERAEPWIRSNSLSLQRLSEPVVVRQALHAIGRRLDGSPAAPSTNARKSSAFYSALAYAVELDHLATNPLDKLKWTRPMQTDSVDRRVVVNPDQARALLDAVDRIYPALTAFFATLYYAGLRPAEVRHLRRADCHLPERGWGRLLLVGSTPTVGRQWTDSGTAQPDRQLKHRAARDTRPVPAPPELVAILRKHIDEFPPSPDGRIFVTRTGRAGVPLAGPYATPISLGIVYRTWHAARSAVLTAEQVASPLAKRPYDLRHAAVSLWLNAGVPPTQVAEWAGHSVNVLLRVYAKVIDGQQDEAMRRIQDALSVDRPSRDDRDPPETSARIPHRHP